MVEKASMVVTLQDIADKIGVRRSTVSRVLNNSAGTTRVSEARRQQILKLAHELGYHPNSSARALSRKQTGHVGFMLSDRVTDGLANMYFAHQLVGVEQECRKRGYGVNVSLYNLSNLESFIFPPKVGERSVDGLILAGYIEASVVAKFTEFGVPCIAIGDNLEVQNLIPTISCDVSGGVFDAVTYGVSLGHRRILYVSEPSRRGKEVAALLSARIAASPETAACQFEVANMPDVRGDYSDASRLGELLLAQPVSERATLVLATDQTLAALIGVLREAGVDCPKDISVIAVNDTLLCQFSAPQITAVNQGVAELGVIAASLLIDHLEAAMAMNASASRNNFPCKLVVRRSCAAPG
jgi:LacI family repressor for deo operon, udp, cdd, tsx, nupC, and nupG